MCYCPTLGSCLVGIGYSFVLGYGLMMSFKQRNIKFNPRIKLHHNSYIPSFGLFWSIKTQTGQVPIKCSKYTYNHKEYIIRILL